jgi:hypothetical protein
VVVDYRLMFVITQIAFSPAFMVPTALNEPGVPPQLPLPGGKVKRGGLNPATGDSDIMKEVPPPNITN